MTETDNSHTTPYPPQMPPSAFVPPEMGSPEYVAYLRVNRASRRMTDVILLLPDECGTLVAKLEEIDTKISSLVMAARRAVLEKPARTQREVIEMAKVLRRELWHEEEDVDDSSPLPEEPHFGETSLEGTFVAAAVSMGARMADPTPELLELRELLAQETKLCSALDAATKERDEKAVEPTNAAIAVFERSLLELSDRICAKPKGSFETMRDLAVVAEYWWNKIPEGKSDPRADKVHENLLAAVLAQPDAEAQHHG